MVLEEGEEAILRPAALVLFLIIAEAGCSREGGRASLELEPVDGPGLAGLRTKASGRLRLVNVWATWCVPCVRELPELMAIQDTLGPRGLDLVTVAATYPDEREQVRNALRKAGATSAARHLIFGSDRKYDLLEALDPEWEGGLPYTLLIRPDGQVAFRHMGELDLAALRAQIESELSSR